MNKPFQLEVNGKKREVSAPPETPLLEVLRNDLELTGAKYGCGESQCGACTVLLEGTAIRSCVFPVGNVESKPITTIEGIEENGKLSPVQEAFLEEDAMQCGYCTSGMIMAATAFLKTHPNPTESEVVAGMNGNICRCCAYPRIVKAVLRAAKTMRGDL